MKLVNNLLCTSLLFIIVITPAAGNSFKVESPKKLFDHQEKYVIVNGQVKGSENEPLPGASVFIRALTIGTSTDFNGAFTLDKVPVGRHLVEVSYLGFEPFSQEIEIDGSSNINIGDITLSPSTNQLGEVIITGSLEGQQRAYNQQKKFGQYKIHSFRRSH